MSFPSIAQFRNLILNVKYRAWYAGKDALGNAIYDETKPIPTLKCHGTVKIHGTNAGVTRRDGELVAMSRTVELSVGADNEGFAAFVIKNADAFHSIFDKLGDVTLRGEWCGKGIQSGTAVNQLDKLFVIFAVCVGEGDDREWLHLETLPDFEVPESRIFSVQRFGTYEVEIDFANPASVQEKLEALTQAVERECPVGKHFGVSGVGEGIVWCIRDPDFTGSDFWFKAKGEKHKISNTKRIVEIDPEVAASVEAFVGVTLSEHRLQQGIEILRVEGKEVAQRSTGDYLKWVVNDVLKEELDRMEASNLTKKDVSKALQTRARKWWFSHLDQQVGL